MKRVTLHAFRPKALNCEMIWQVFWLMPSPGDLPIRRLTDSG